MGGRGVSAGHPCSTHALTRLLRYAAKRAVRIMPWSGSMLDETGFYAPSLAHNALPGRPWPGISVFLGHNSTFSMQLRYSLARECVCAARVPGAYDACDNIPVCCHFGRFRFIAISSLTLYIPNIFLYSLIFTENGNKTFQEVDKKI